MQLQDQHGYTFKCLPDPARSTTEKVQRPVPLQYHTKYYAKSTQEQFHSSTTPSTMPKQYKGPYPSSTVPSTAPHLYEGQYHSSTMHTDSGKPSITVQHTAQLMTSFRITTPSTAMSGRTTTKQVNPVHIHPETSHKTLLEHCTHVHQPAVQVCKPGESLALRKVKHQHNGRTSVNRLSLTKQDILSQYSSCFEGIGHFPGDLYKFHLKPEPRLHDMHQGKFQSTLNLLLRRKSSL